MTHSEILLQLSAREPIFHRPSFSQTVEEFATMMAEDYWEIGASGARYGRAFILEHLAQNPPVDAAEAGWQCYGFSLRELGTETYLLTYTLAQQERTTQRSTIWRKQEHGWVILYHQGTIAVSPQG